MFGEGEDAIPRDASGNRLIPEQRRVAKEIPIHTLNCNNCMLFISRKLTVKHANPVENIFFLTSAVG